jgi:hypothetical protein
MKQVPVAIGLMVCEHVIIEEGTRNATPVNCFSRRKVDQVPTGPLPFTLFAMLTDGAGRIDLEVVIERLDTNDEIYRRALTFTFTDPLQDVRCLFRIPDCSFPVVGVYQAILFAEGAPLAHRRFRITL